MATIEELRADHATLRRVLTELAEAVTITRPRDAVQAAYALSLRLLTAHLQREEQLMSRHLEHIRSALRAHTLQDDVDPYVVLRDLQTLFAAWRECPTSSLIIHLRRLIEELRERFEEEEREIFPVVEHAADHFAGSSEFLVKAW